jgi:hypothetical protein
MMAVRKDMQNELDIVRDVSARLEGGGLAYMLTGSMAMNYYAQPRMTRDIDLVVALTARDTDTVMRLFAPDYYVSRDAASSSIAHESLFNLIHQESVIKVDCIVRKSSPYRRAEFEHAASASPSKISPPGLRARKTSLPPVATGTTSNAGRRNWDCLSCGRNANHDRHLA